MGENSESNSLMASASVVAAVIGCVTAVLSAVLPWWLGSHGQPAAPTTPIAPVVAADVGPIGAQPLAVRVLPNLTFGAWTIYESIDEAGTEFNGSTLKFATQRETPAGLELTGFFEWHSGGEVLGREHVIANYDAASRQLFIEGQYVQSPTNRLAVGSFSARLSDDGRHLIDGRWGNTPGNLAGVPGSWAARR